MQYLEWGVLNRTSQKFYIKYFEILQKDKRYVQVHYYYIRYGFQFSLSLKKPTSLKE